MDTSQACHCESLCNLSQSDACERFADVVGRCASLAKDSRSDLTWKCAYPIDIMVFLLWSTYASKVIFCVIGGAFIPRVKPPTS
jgi:hypothetical protein